MVTGNNTSDSKDFSKFNQLIVGNSAVVNLRYDGLSIVISEPNSKKVADVVDISWEPTKKTEGLLAHFQKTLNAEQINLATAASVKWILSFSKFTLVPDVLYQKEKASSYLKHTSKLKEENIIVTDTWKNFDAIMVYALPTPINVFVSSQNQNSSIAHVGYSLYNLQQLQASKNDFCFLHVSSSFAELLIVQNGKLIFFNQFEYQEEEDLIYLLLFAFEQNGIIAPELTLKYSGKIKKGDSLHKRLSTYIGKVEEIGLPAGILPTPTLAPSQLKNWSHLILSL